MNVSKSRLYVRRLSCLFLNNPVLEIDKRFIHSLLLYQVSMFSLLNNLSFFKHHYSISMHNGLKSMGNDDNCSVFHHLFYNFGYFCF